MLAVDLPQLLQSQAILVIVISCPPSKVSQTERRPMCWQLTSHNSSRGDRSCCMSRARELLPPCSHLSFPPKRNFWDLNEHGKARHRADRQVLSVISMNLSMCNMTGIGIRHSNGCVQAGPGPRVNKRTAQLALSSNFHCHATRSTTAQHPPCKNGQRASGLC